MLKKIISTLFALIMVISLFTIMIVSFSAEEVYIVDEGTSAELLEVGADMDIADTAVPSESQFRNSISSLQSTYAKGKYWNKYSSSDYSKAGNTPCNGISYSQTYYGMIC